MNLDVHFSSSATDWETPDDLFAVLDDEFHFGLDVCATKKNRKCKVFFSIEDNGLAQSWGLGQCWMNPPYGRAVSAWVEKAYKESKSGATVVCLLPSRTDTKWWHNWVMKADEIRFIRGRLQFKGAKSSAPFPSAIVVFRPQRKDPLWTTSVAVSACR